MRVAWFIPVNHRNYNRMPASIWIRCLQLLPYLEEQGIKCQVNAYDKRADIAVFVRWQDERALRILQRQRNMGAKIIFDLCVNYFDVAGWFEGGYGSLSEHRTQALVMAQASEVVTCASSFIAERAVAHGFEAQYLPDSIDFRHFRLTKSPADFEKSTITTIWSGNSVKARESLEIIPVLKKLKLPFILITDKPVEALPYAKYVPWTYETFPRAILEGDICVVPRRTDNPYDQGHSIYKVGVFMAQGVPALASPLPSYRELLGEGRGGAICETPNDWQGKLEMLISERRRL
ncbi:MAG: glycosyltransferase, partial [Desulfobacteraceae bacterium]|nr:glycosyltransferase [Desulfobacteraceae bacterium]